MVADDPHEKIRLKTFQCEILNDHESLRSEQTSFTDLPVIVHVDQKMITENYFKIKNDIENLIESEIEILLNTL
jgi:hypothetical protein